MGEIEIPREKVGDAHGPQAHGTKRSYGRRFQADNEAQIVRFQAD
jgi:hypothetical protein